MFYDESTLHRLRLYIMRNFESSFVDLCCFAQSFEEEEILRMFLWLYESDYILGLKFGKEKETISILIRLEWQIYSYDELSFVIIENM